MLIPEQQNPLFRKSAIDHAHRRISGSVSLAVPPSSKYIGGLFALIIGAGAIFAASATYARRETVTGWLIPAGGLIRVTARQGGTVETLRGVEGENVTAGAELATLRLSSDVTAGDAGRALSRNFDAEAEADADQSRASKSKLNEQVTEISTRISALKAQLAETRRRIEILVSRQKLSQITISRDKGLVDQGYLPLPTLEAAEEASLSAAQDVSVARAAELDLERQLGDLDHQLRESQSEIAVAEAQARQTRATLAQRRVTAETQDIIVATAPISGRIVAIPVERGQAVAAGGTVAVITPTQENLTAELYVPSRAAGFIKAGQNVKLMYQAFPYQTFGTGEGKVISVSRTVLAPSEVGIQGLTVNEPVFRVRTDIARQTVQAYGANVPLQPGMLLSADIIVDQRNLIKWLLDPIYAVGRR